jgi:integrase
MTLRHVGDAIPERTLHAMRHTFVVNYLRNGLQKVAAHSSLGMTRRYASFQTEDLQRMHGHVSLRRR